METFKLHPTGRSEDASQAKARQNAIIRKELLQSSKAVTKSQRVKLGRRGLTRRTASHGILLNVCGFCSVSFSGFGKPEIMWGFSSAGRAPALQAGGQRFDPANLHHIWVASSVG